MLKYLTFKESNIFRSKKEMRFYFLLLFLLLFFSLSLATLLIFYKNSIPFSSPSFFPVVKRRIVAVVAMLIAAICQSMATVSFQTVSNNRIITPSLLGFEAIYSAIHTSLMFFFGIRALLAFSSVSSFVIQIFLMMAFCLILYGWLLSSKKNNIQFMLLVGVILGSGLRSVSSFLRRLLTPSEFDILQARLYGSVSNADVAYFPIAIPIVIVVVSLLFLYAKKLNLISLGRDIAVNLGLNYRLSIVYVLILISLLMSVSTALLGPLSFFGFLTASLSYQLVPTYDHKHIFMMSIVLGFFILTASYFLMYYVFSAQGVVSIIIELFGGIAFIIMILKKGNL